MVVMRYFGGLADDSVVENGYASLPDLPGIGFESKSELSAMFTSLL